MFRMGDHWAFGRFREISVMLCQNKEFYCLQLPKIFIAKAVRICADSICTNRWLTTFPPQTGAETMETAPLESSGKHFLRSKTNKTSGNCYKKHQKSLGKDEAGGSNPPISSISEFFLLPCCDENLIYKLP